METAKGSTNINAQASQDTKQGPEKKMPVKYRSKQIIISGKPQIILRISIFSQKTHLHEFKHQLVKSL